MNRIPEALALLLLCGSAAAADSKAAKAADTLRPTGPVTVTADRAEFDKHGMMVYTGKVQLTSDTLKLAGDKLVLQQFEGGQYEAHVTGNPATLDHSGNDGGGAEAAVPVHAQAAALNYDTRSGVVDVVGHAHMTRGADQKINSDTIHYNVAARRIEAAGGVTLEMMPPPPKKDAEAKP